MNSTNYGTAVSTALREVRSMLLGVLATGGVFFGLVMPALCDMNVLPVSVMVALVTIMGAGLITLLTEMSLRQAVNS